MSVDWDNIQLLGVGRSQGYIDRMSKEEKEKVIMVALAETNQALRQSAAHVGMPAEDDAADYDWQNLKLLGQERGQRDVGRMSENEKVKVILAALREKCRPAGRRDMRRLSVSESELVEGANDSASLRDASGFAVHGQERHANVRLEQDDRSLPRAETNVTIWDTLRQTALEKRKNISASPDAMKRIRIEATIDDRQFATAETQQTRSQLDLGDIKLEEFDEPRRSARILSSSALNVIDLVSDSEDEEQQELESPYAEDQAPLLHGPKHKKRSGGKFLSMKEMQMILWVPDQLGNGTWHDINSLDAAVRSRLKELWRSFYEGDYEKLKFWRRMTGNPMLRYEKSCCAAWLITNQGTVKRPTFDKYGGEHKKSACDWCVKAERLCAHCVEHEGIAKLGLVPLPERLRRGKSWRELDFWFTGQAAALREGPTYAKGGQYVRD